MICQPTHLITSNVAVPLILAWRFPLHKEAGGVDGVHTDPVGLTWDWEVKGAKVRGHCTWKDKLPEYCHTLLDMWCSKGRNFTRRKGMDELEGPCLIQSCPVLFIHVEIVQSTFFGQKSKHSTLQHVYFYKTNV